MSGDLHRDAEVDEDTGDIGGWLDVWWIEGHSHDPDDLLLAVVADALASEGRCPAIHDSDGPVEMWQRTVAVGDAVLFNRGVERRPGWEPVTVIDLERHSSGLGRCGVRDCLAPAESRTPLRVALTDVSIDVPLCRTHRSEVPDPHWRCLLVPVGHQVVIEIEADR